MSEPGDRPGFAVRVGVRRALRRAWIPFFLAGAMAVLSIVGLAAQGFGFLRSMVSALLLIVAVLLVAWGLDV